MSVSNYERVITELCGLIGFVDKRHLLGGGKLRMNDHTISFFHDTTGDTEGILVYIDMGSPSDDTAKIYADMLEINFMLGIGQRGCMSLHPDTHHVFYIFRFTLTDEALAQTLLDTLIRFIGDVGIETLKIRRHKQLDDAFELQHAEEFRNRLIRGGSI